MSYYDEDFLRLFEKSCLSRQVVISKLNKAGFRILGIRTYKDMVDEIFRRAEQREGLMYSEHVALKVMDIKKCESIELSDSMDYIEFNMCFGRSEYGCHEYIKVGFRVEVDVYYNDYVSDDLKEELYEKPFRRKTKHKG